MVEFINFRVISLNKHLITDKSNNVDLIYLSFYNFKRHQFLTCIENYMQLLTIRNIFNVIHDISLKEKFPFFINFVRISLLVCCKRIV